jgi:hypothetical protein
VFSSRSEAERAQEMLLSRGVPNDEVQLMPVRKPFWVNLNEVDIPTDEAVLYEPYIPNSAWMLVVRTNRLTMDQIDECVEQCQGLVVRAGVAPPLSDLPISHSQEV